MFNTSSPEQAFDISTGKDKALTWLYILLAGASFILSISHYFYGYFDILLNTLTIACIFLFSAILLSQNRNQGRGKFIHLATLGSITLLIQYQFLFQPNLALHWFYILPILATLSLPKNWALSLVGLILSCLYMQLNAIYDMQQSFNYFLPFLLFTLGTECYAQLNHIRQTNRLKLAVTDFQSGAYNSRFLLQVLKQEISRCQVSNRTLSIFSLCIDDYPQILDIHGRDVSAALLKEFRLTLLKQLRAGDEVFHQGKGMFYILLPNCPMEGVLLLKERLQVQLKNNSWGEVGELQLSTGLATLKEDENADSFLHRASEQIYQQQQTALRLLAFKQT